MPDERRVSACEELADVLADARAAGVPDGDLELVQRPAADGFTRSGRPRPPGHGPHDPQPPRSGHAPSASGCARCVKFGLRFSRNELIPSWPSGVTTVDAISSIA